MAKLSGPNALVQQFNELVKLDGVLPEDVVKMIKQRFNFDWDPQQQQFKPVACNHKAPDWPSV